MNPPNIIYSNGTASTPGDRFRRYAAPGTVLERLLVPILLDLERGNGVGVNWPYAQTPLGIPGSAREMAPMMAGQYGHLHSHDPEHADELRRAYQMAADYAEAKGVPFWLSTGTAFFGGGYESVLLSGIPDNCGLMLDAASGLRTGRSAREDGIVSMILRLAKDRPVMSEAAWDTGPGSEWQRELDAVAHFQRQPPAMDTDSAFAWIKAWKARGGTIPEGRTLTLVAYNDPVPEAIASIPSVHVAHHFNSPLLRGDT